MKTISSKSLLGGVTALAFCLLLTASMTPTAHAATDTPGTSTVPSYGYGPGMMGPGMMGPGMMYGWTPEQREQHWEQMRALGYGPGMMWNLTPEQRQQHWAQMSQWGYGPGMMGPARGRGPGMWGPRTWTPSAGAQ